MGQEDDGAAMTIRLIPFDLKDGEIVLDIGVNPSIYIELGRGARIGWQNDRETGQTPFLESLYVADLTALLAEREQAALEEGIRMYAWWKDGTQYVGTSGRTLQQAIAEIRAQKET